MMKKRCADLSWKVPIPIVALVPREIETKPAASALLTTFAQRMRPAVRTVGLLESSVMRLKRAGDAQLAYARRRRIWARVRQRLLFPNSRKVLFLSRLPFLAECSADELIQLASAMHLRVLPHIRRIVQPFTLPARFSVIIDGQIETCDATCRDMLGPGDYYGAEALGGAYAAERIPAARSASTLVPTLQFELDAGESGESARAEIQDLLRRLRPRVEVFLKASMLLRFPQFGYLRANLPLRSRVAECLQYRSYPKGTPLIEHGTPVKSVSLFFLVRGTVDVVAINEAKEQVGLGTVSDGDQKPYVGELSVFGKVVPTVTVLCRTSVHCLVLVHAEGGKFGSILPEFKDQAELTARKVRAMNMANLAQSVLDSKAITQLIAETKARVSELRPHTLAKMDMSCGCFLPRVICPVLLGR
jgi:CRP-like cAMP-binding protein